MKKLRDIKGKPAIIINIISVIIIVILLIPAALFSLEVIGGAVEDIFPPKPTTLTEKDIHNAIPTCEEQYNEWKESNNIHDDMHKNEFMCGQ